MYLLWRGCFSSSIAAKYVDALPRPSQSAFLPLNDPSGTFRSALPAASFNSTQNNSNRYIFSLALNLKVFFSFFFSCVHKNYYFEIYLSHSLPTRHTVRKEITAKKNAVLNSIFLIYLISINAHCFFYLSADIKSLLRI